MADRLIRADALYRKAAEREEEARQIVIKAFDREDDAFNWARWSAILGERSAFKHDIADAPTVDAEPVRHGHWINTGFMEVKCSICGAIQHELEDTNYCPNCGAKMDGERREDETD